MMKMELPPRRAEVGLQSFLESWGASPSGRRSVVAVIAALAEAGAAIGAMMARGPLQDQSGLEIGAADCGGNKQGRLEILAEAMVLSALKKTPTAYYAAGDENAILTIDPAGDVAVAVDPIDGSSNIDANITIGTIFSIFPASAEGATASFFRPGREQIAAGYFVYGPHLAMMLTLGEGVGHFVFCPARKSFFLVADRIKIAASSREFAINASNYRHWDEPIRLFVDDCFEGSNGPHGDNFSIRWVASLVAETHRIFTRGGVFIYPADQRPGYENGRLRLLYGANPISWLVEQAGGRATDGDTRILEKTPTTLHERTPLIFGSPVQVERIESYCRHDNFQRSRAPLFGLRSLFRA
jgi:fructose-1,6-bisphosphatase I